MDATSQPRTVHDVVEQLRGGPAVLLLGQGYLSLETGRDPILQAAARKYGIEPHNYFALFDPAFSADEHANHAWLNRLSMELPVAPWLQTVANYEWSAIYTTAIDSHWIDAFRLPWRELAPVFDEQARPAEPRDRANLHCTLLYGNVRWDEIAPVPRNQFDMRARTQVATALLRRLPELLTPRGVLIIDGYTSADWLPADQLGPSLAQLSPGQAHMFTVTNELAANADIQYLVDNDRLQLHHQSLAAMFASAGRDGRLQMGQRTTLASGGHELLLDGEERAVPQDLWRRVSRQATILNDSLLDDPPPLTQTSRYYSFREFLSRSDGIPNWDGYKRGFAFRRHFEQELAGPSWL